VDELQVAVLKTNATSLIIDGKKFYLHSRLCRSDFYSKIIQYVCQQSEERIADICRDIFGQLNVHLTENDMKPYRFLDWTQISEMSESGLVAFGSHTVTHRNLTTLSDDVLKYELQESKRTLEDRIGKPVLALAYPYGGQGFFDRKIIDQARDEGYACAFTTIQGKIDDKSENRFMLKRVMLFDYQNQGAVALKLRRWADCHRARKSGIINLSA
jgi:hypothetical protein